MTDGDIIYVRPDGDDANTGASPEEAVKTIQRAIDLAFQAVV